jgi:FO synthase
MLERMTRQLTEGVEGILEASLEGKEMSVAGAERLLRVEGADFHALLWAADCARREDKGDDVTYVVCRNLNFTNICYVGCSFCGFYRHKHEDDAYDHSMDAMLEKVRDGVARGATEICIQGGIHPKKDHTHYREILVGIKAEFPDIHLHAFSPEEIDYGHGKSGMELSDYLRWLVDAGLGSMPGTAAEILDDEVRQQLSPRKLMTERWKEIIRAAHGIGLPTTSTVMYGHIEEPRHIAQHLGTIRDIQRDTGGFTEFVPLGFIHERNKLYNVLGSRPGASMSEDLRMVAISRLFLRPFITNIQVSWVKMGHKLGQMALQAGANDYGGSLMEESISRESGSHHGENTPPEEFRRLIREIDRVPVERSTIYRELRRFDDPAQDPASLEPAPAGAAGSGAIQIAS